MTLLLMQPLLAAGALPHLPRGVSRRVHRASGALLTLLVVGHVGGLWITSPPDVLDALAFASPTPFSVWGVIAMWAVFLTAALAALRRRRRSWHLAHRTLAVLIVVCSVIHAVLIEGTMEPVSKAVLCTAALLATLATVLFTRVQGAGTGSR
ncbi:Myxococcales GC_trans_RRR domain-containing protein [Alloyangia pacifica]|uniref:Myxococcales GC_trans_RRR domain-containing protein n=2 Tax=Alloyangia pacifica TaxID=311180 RepID=A0A1I6SXI3_9RHOB|nr:Myxococcales GC_trans_RRR domain-containing protein [Alloyangia pacifica]SFS81610.1 Myxococcales GC_trans_RRR domain-containing protein [Alloyangia pacifica]